MSFTKRGYFIDTNPNVAYEIKKFDESEEVNEATNPLDNDDSSIKTDTISMKDDFSRKDKIRIPKCIISSRKGTTIKLMSINGQPKMLLDE